MITATFRGGPLNSARGSGERCKLPQREPQPKANLVHFSLKIWRPVATILMIMWRINWPVYQKIFLSKTLAVKILCLTPGKFPGVTQVPPDLPPDSRAPGTARCRCNHGDSRISRLSLRPISVKVTVIVNTWLSYSVNKCCNKCLCLRTLLSFHTSRKFATHKVFK